MYIPIWVITFIGGFILGALTVLYMGKRMNDKEQELQNEQV